MPRGCVPKGWAPKGWAQKDCAQSGQARVLSVVSAATPATCEKRGAVSCDQHPLLLQASMLKWQQSLDCVFDWVRSTGCVRLGVFDWVRSTGCVRLGALLAPAVPAWPAWHITCVLSCRQSGVCSLSLPTMAHLRLMLCFHALPASPPPIPLAMPCCLASVHAPALQRVRGWRAPEMLAATLLCCLQSARRRWSH